MPQASLELSLLTNLAGRLRQSASLDEILRALQRDLAALMPCDLLGLSFLHPDGEALVLGPLAGALSAPLVTGRREPLPASLRGLVARGTPKIIEVTAAAARKLRWQTLAQLARLDLRACLAMPLVAPEGTRGLLWLASRTRQAFRAEHITLLRLVADRLALSLESARLSSRLQAGGRVLEATRAAQSQLADENRLLRDALAGAQPPGEAVGGSLAWRKTLRQIELVAPADATVLLRGETGTGKELLARMIHRHSPRRERPFVAVNGAALASDLAASELFGHERGAFTGALERRIGRIELAQGGTLFLDEVGELSPELQALLLRVLQEREFERVGGAQTLKTDVRVVAATNRNLEQARAEGRFRDDLFFRLNVFPVNVPPLRERKEDLEALIACFIGKYAPRAGRAYETIEPQTLSRCIEYHWPGNVRELENLVERHVLLCAGPVFSMDPHWEPGETPATEARRYDLKELVHGHIQRVLRMTRGKIYGADGAASLLGLKPSTLQARLKVMGLDRKQA